MHQLEEAEEQVLRLLEHSAAIVQVRLKKHKQKKVQQTGTYSLLGCGVLCFYG